jgi:hypothetical protein
MRSFARDAVVGSKQLGDGHHEATGYSYAVHQDERERAGGGGIHRYAGVHKQAFGPDPLATQSSGRPDYTFPPQLVGSVEAVWLVHILSCQVAGIPTWPPRPYASVTRVLVW